MPVKGTKSLVESKHQAIITTYTTGAAISPVTGHVSTYVDLAAADQHRELEVHARLTELINRAREEGYRRPSSGVCYYYMNLADAKADIAFTLLNTDIVAGMVAIGISGTVRGGGRGSEILDSCWEQIIAWVGEQDRLTV